MRIVSVGRAFPDNYYDQETLVGAFERYWGGVLFNPARLTQLHQNVQVGGRHLALPIDAYEAMDSFTATNDAFISCGTDVGERAIAAALEPVRLAAEDIDHLFFVSVTGVATPSIDARLANRLATRPDMKRTPIFGLGCVAGAAGIARAADYLRAFPDHIAVLLSVELCSLTLQREDLSIPNLIASGLFGDGAAAVVLAGAEHPLAAAESPVTEDVQTPADATRGPRVVDTRSVFYRDTEDLMGWEIGTDGFRVVLSADVPRVIGERIRGDVESLLSDHGLGLADISVWLSHPGGPRILQEIEAALELPAEALARTWRSLADIGNLSSASVLMVLGDALDEEPRAPGSWGLLMAMGPGFCSELVLLQW